MRPLITPRPRRKNKGSARDRAGRNVAPEAEGAVADRPGRGYLHVGSIGWTVAGGCPMRTRNLGIVLALLLAGPPDGRAADTRDTSFLHEPAIGPERIVFVYADDLWTARP